MLFPWDHPGQSSRHPSASRTGASGPGPGGASGPSGPSGSAITGPTGTYTIQFIGNYDRNL